MTENTYTTKFGIGEVVYTANKYGFEKQIITRLRIDGIGHKVKYGFKETAPSFFELSFGREETWYKPSEVFKTKESAERKHELLEQAADLKKRQEDELYKKQRKAELLQEIEELEDTNE